jgi:hypothetical protein
MSTPKREENMMLSDDIADIQLDPEGIDAALEELGVQSPLSPETQRMLASRSMIALSMAAAIVNEGSYHQALAALEPLDLDDCEAAFLRDFSKALADDVVAELGTASSVAPLFLKRVDQLSMLTV